MKPGGLLEAIMELSHERGLDQDAIVEAIDQRANDTTKSRHGKGGTKRPGSLAFFGQGVAIEYGRLRGRSARYPEHDRGNRITG